MLSLGASLADLTYEGEQLLLRYGSERSMTRAGMAVLAPFANRVRNGEYLFEGVKYKLSVNEEGHAIHGFVKDKLWRVVERSNDFVEMGVDLDGEQGYPFKLSFTVKYEIVRQGLKFSITAINVGDVDAPITMGAHPYFTASTPRNQWLIDAGDAFRLEMIDKIPTGRILPQRLMMYLGEHDDCYRLDGDGVKLMFSSNRGLMIKLDGFPFIQLFTPYWANAVAVEPMTGAPDAFNNGMGLSVLTPGKSLTASFTVYPI